MREFTTVDLNKQVGEVTNAARAAPVVITRHRKPSFILMTTEHYETLTHHDDPRQSFTLETMSDDIRDGLLALADAYDADAFNEVEDAGR